MESPLPHRFKLKRARAFEHSAGPMSAQAALWVLTAALLGGFISQLSNLAGERPAPLAPPVAERTEERLSREALQADLARSLFCPTPPPCPEAPPCPECTWLSVLPLLALAAGGGIAIGAGVVGCCCASVGAGWWAGRRQQAPPALALPARKALPAGAYTSLPWNH